ncbi:hypothetical protein F3Y22_tig00002684pilonHSYRG00048 [Hibiscus syriacus]|uniref:RNA-directed DNA polymerase n=1 Tax=Hibiscus syriacus TaxID=106335 RepID=A0A6A3CWY1_HIBSY|nr:hypothetical protein F3Y22_tig00002684pilonHSYRG00048 [Hibiscus syriacus]
MAPQHGEATGSDGNGTRNTGKKRAPSKDVLTSIQEKVTRLEDSMTEAKVVLDVLESVDLERLGSLDLDKLESLESIREEVQDSLNELDVKATDRGDSLEAMVVALRKEVEELKSKGSDFEVVELKREVELLKTELLVCKATFGNNIATVAPKALATGITEDARKVSIASVYLSEVTLMWWRHRCNDVKCGNAAIETWAEFQVEFKEQFYPEYTEDEARSKLRRLKQEGSLREHVQKFVELMLQVLNLSEEDGFFTFMDGLKPWAKNELRQRGVKELSVALTTADSSDRDKASKSDKDSSGTGKPSNGKHSDKKDKQIIQCYNCKGQGHLARDYPQKNKLSAIKEKDGEESETLKLGSILSTMEVKKGRKKKGLMFVDITLAGQKLSALVDTGASELFMSEPVAKILGLYVEKVSGSIKTVNAKEVPIAGVVKGIELTVEVGPERKPSSRRPGVGAKVLSAIQFSKAACKEEPSFLDVLVCDEPVTTKEVPDVVSHVLAEFQDVMHTELPKKLPPKREFKDLLDASYIQPSKSSYATPGLFQKKHDGSLQMCIDYRALNKLMVNNKYPIPLIADLFDQLGGARWFTKLDLRSGYYQVRIVEGDEPKTACVTSKTLEEHVEHLKQVFLVLQENELFVKEEKCSFAKTEVPFLGHIIGGGKIWMDRDKVQAIDEWKVPTKVTELRSFLGLANYYRRFVKSYSKIVVHLTELLKKDKAWDWGPKCQSPFDEIKLAMTSEPVLVLPDHTKPFEVFTDASDVAIGGVLMQEGHPVAYESWKLNETERRYTVHEKEMTAVVHCLRTWRHYLLGSKFVVFTDNVANSYFLTQKKLSPKQARWQEFLAEFDLSLENKPGKVNSVANALSRRCDMEFVSLPTGQMRERIKEGLSHNPIAPSLIELANEGKTRKFWLDGGLLYARGHCLYVPQFKGLRKELMRECHDSKWTGHPGIHRTLALIAEHYYWPHMGNDVEAYPLPIPKKPWESLSMDFIIGLPVSDGFSSIMVVVDRFSKYGTFIPASKVFPAEEAARLFLKYVVKYWGVPKMIISDRDTSVHPQTNGQTKRVNALVETYLRHYRSEATNQSPFEIIIGQQPLTPNAVVTGYQGPNPTAYQFAKEWQEQHELARACLLKAGKRTKKWADRKSRDVNFEVGDLVLAKLSGIMRNPYHKGLVRRYEEPFKVLKRVGTMAYKLELPLTIKAHPVFHVSLLKTYHQDEEELDRGKSHRAPVGVKVSYEREVEAIHAERAVHGVGK